MVAPRSSQQASAIAVCAVQVQRNSSPTKMQQKGSSAPHINDGGPPLLALLAEEVQQVEAAHHVHVHCDLVQQQHLRAIGGRQTAGTYARLSRSNFSTASTSTVNRPAAAPGRLQETSPSVTMHVISSTPESTVISSSSRTCGQLEAGKQQERMLKCRSDNLPLRPCRP